MNLDEEIKQAEALLKQMLKLEKAIKQILP